MKQTAVEFLAEKYNYITWMRNRDEISAGTADEWRAEFLEQAKEMDKERMIEFAYGFYDNCFTKDGVIQKSAGEYYNEIFNTK